MQQAHKFRSISWLRTQGPSFEETLIMRSNHAKIGMVIEESYVKEDAERERDLVMHHGYIAVESVIFSDDMHGITMYSDAGNFGIIGVHIHSDTNDQSVGYDYATAKNFSIHGPAEVIAEVDVRTGFRSTALTVRTFKDEIYNVSASDLANQVCDTGEN